METNMPGTAEDIKQLFHEEHCLDVNIKEESENCVCNVHKSRNFADFHCKKLTLSCRELDSCNIQPVPNREVALNIKKEIAHKEAIEDVQQFSSDINIKEESQNSTCDVHKSNSIEDFVCNDSYDIKPNPRLEEVLNTKGDLVHIKEGIFLKEPELSESSMDGGGVIGSKFKLSVTENDLHASNSPLYNACNVSDEIYTENNQISCNDYEFEPKQTILETQIKDTPFSCYVCEFRCDNQDSLLDHMRMHAQEQPFLSSASDDKSSNNVNLGSDIKNRTGEKLLSCSICEYRCSKKSHLVQHTRTHTGEKPFSCDICEFKSNRKYNLGRHMTTHTGEKQFSCNVCDYKSSNKNSVADHMRTHTGEKPFSCPVCEYKCKIKSNLRSHMIIHMVEKQFCCNVCGHKSNRKYHLIQHMRTHTGEKPYPCDICHYRFNKKSKLTRHRKIHSGEKPLRCSLCEFRCIRRDNLMNHIRTHAKAQMRVLAE